MISNFISNNLNFFSEYDFYRVQNFYRLGKYNSNVLQAIGRVALAALLFAGYPLFDATLAK
jgi:hypothetical protein